MPGLGYDFLPLPQFSSVNPYWSDPRERWGFLLSDYRPRHTAQDFLFATTWEIWRADWHMAYCVRIAMQRTARIMWRIAIQQQLRAWCLKQKEKKNEEAA